MAQANVKLVKSDRNSNPVSGRGVLGFPASGRGYFSDAFAELEGEVYDLARAARLANEQLYRAVGELQTDGTRFVEVPDANDTELAMFAVSQVLKMAEELRSLWLRLHNEGARHS